MSPVTDHAVVRFLVRIHGMTHLCDRYPSDRERAAAGAELLGLTIEEARDLVCPPRLQAAIAMGLTGVVRAPNRILAFHDGIVATCMLPVEKTKKVKHRLGRERALA